MGLLRFLKFLGPSEENYNLQSLMITLYQSECYLGRCQHPVSTLGVNTYLKENAKWPTLPRLDCQTSFRVF